MVLAAILTIAAAIIIGLLQPYTRYAYRALVYTVTNTAWNSALERGTFFTGFGDMTIMVDDISDGGRRLSGIFLHRVEPDGGTTTTAAEGGQLYRSRTDFRLILRLSKGAWIQSDAGGSHPAVLTFDRVDVPLDLAGSAQLAKRGLRGSELTMIELWNARHSPPPGMTTAKIVAELHSRLVRILSLPILPFVAIPLGIVSRRARRGAGLVVGMILLVLFHYVLRFGESMVGNGVLSPALGLWLPWAAFGAIGAWAFHTTSKRPGYNPVMAVLDRVSDGFDAARRRFARQGSSQ
jgi:lipopolysaccharide export system permease protein